MPESQGLSAKAIFNSLMQKKTVRIPIEFKEQLLNHLNVIKSREQKLFKSLGLDYVASIIQAEKIYGPNSKSEIKEPIIVAYDFTLIPKPEVKRYPVFQIEEQKLNAIPAK